MKSQTYLNLAIRAPRRLEYLRSLARHHASGDWRAARTTGYDDLWMSTLCAGSQGEGNRRVKIWTSVDGGPYFKRQCFADECESAPRDVRMHKGWYTDGADMSATARGVVARLPHGRFLAGYYWSENGEYVYAADVYEEEREAILAADSMAQRFGEEESDYQTRWREAENLRDKIKDQLKRLRECLVLRHEKCMQYTREEIHEIVQSIRKNRDVLATEYKQFEE